MIITLFGGGLGNQMFQYALGRHLSIKNNQALKLDYSRYIMTQPDAYSGVRIFSLKNFNIAGEIASEEEISKYFKYYKYNTWTRQLQDLSNKIFPKTYYKKPYVKEPDGNDRVFDPNLLAYGYKDVYIRGFWQSEKYFKDIREVLLKDFTVKTAPNLYNSDLLQDIRKNNSVSLHIRRGDVTDPKNPFGTLPLEYYTKAIKTLMGRGITSSPHFYIFSDDIGWAKANFKLDYPITYVENKIDHDYEDMRLMNTCKYHIVANSTFSWWGAWLATNPDKIVIAPNRFMQRVNKPNYDIYPDSWILV